MDFFINEWEFYEIPTNNDCAPGCACLQDVVADWTEAIGDDPTNTDALLERGNAYFAEDELELAIEDYTTAIRLNPTLAIAYYCRGLVFREKGDLRRGQADQEAAARLDPEFEDD